MNRNVRAGIFSRMAAYSNYLGKRIELHFQAGDKELPAAGILVADSGRSVFLEEQFMCSGRMRQFRWEIPYECVIRVAEPPPQA